MINSQRYIINGNLAYESVARKRIDNSTTRNISERKLLWDGENRLRGISENGYVSLYWYDVGGNRTVKEHLGGEAVWVNSAPAGQRTDTITYSIYPSPYISVTGDRWTKHYYVGSERIASRTGTLSGGFASLNIGDSNSAGNGLTTVNYGIYSRMCQAEEDSIDSLYIHFGVPYEARHTTVRDGGWHLYLPITHSVKAGDGEDASETAGTVQDRSHPHLNGDSQVYFYHRDHLGSTMSVTDSLGATVQQVEYTPWGEVFVERRFGSSGYESPYLFNGKELDEETGLYYYGARYYDPKMSVWYSVDPLALKHHNLTGYVYCRNNPLNFIDLMGLDDIFDEDGVFIRDTGTGSNIYIQNSRQQLFLLSSFDYSEGNEGNRSMLRNVAAHYLSKSDTNPFEIQLYELTPDDPKGAAFANVEGTKKYYVTLSKGRINLFLDNKYDFWSITYHEKLHRYNPNTWGGTIGEIEAIYQQSLHESWSLVSTDYVISQSLYAVSSLQKAIDNNIENLNINQQIEKINKTFIGYGVFNYNPKTKKVTGEITHSLDELIVPGNKKQ